MMITITDEIGTDGTVTVDSHDAVDAIRSWYADAPAESASEVTEVLDRLHGELRRGEYTGDSEAYLGIRITR